MRTSITATIQKFATTFGVAALLLGPLCALAEDSTAQDLSLRDAVESALTKRPELQAAASMETASAQLRRQAGIIPNPRLFYQSENLRPGQDFTQNVDTYAYATEPIEISGKRSARIAAANSGVDHARLAMEQQRRLIELRVAQAYWDALRYQYLRELAEQNVAYYREILDYHEKRFKEGKMAEVDLLRIKLEEARAEASSGSSRLAEAQSKQNLAREMGLSAAADWRLSESFEVLNSPREPASVDNPQDQRIEVQLARQAIDAARANLMVQKAQGRPDIDALLGYKRTAGNNTMIAGFQMNLPVFDRNQGGTAAAQANVEANQDMLRAVQQQSATDLALARMAYDTSRRQITEHYKPLLDQATDIANISRAAYREGGIDLLRLLDAERLRIEAQSAWVESLGNYHQSVLSLEYTEGLEPQPKDKSR